MGLSVDWQVQYIKCFQQQNHGQTFRLFRISTVILLMSQRGRKPQSSRALQSSRRCGQLSAMPCFMGSILYQILKSGLCFLISLASSSGQNDMLLMLQLVLICKFSLGASIRSNVPPMASSMYIMGRKVLELSGHWKVYPFKALWKISTAQSVVPPPGAERQPISPGNRTERTSTPNLLAQQAHQSSPAFLVMPQALPGFMIVYWGVFLGVSGPKAAIELGQNILVISFLLAASRQLYRDLMLICSVTIGFISPVADSRAGRQYTT